MVTKKVTKKITKKVKPKAKKSNVKPKPLLKDLQKPTEKYMQLSDKLSTVIKYLEQGIKEFGDVSFREYRRICRMQNNRLRNVEYYYEKLKDKRMKKRQLKRG